MPQSFIGMAQRLKIILLNPKAYLILFLNVTFNAAYFVSRIHPVGQSGKNRIDKIQLVGNVNMVVYEFDCC